MEPVLLARCQGPDPAGRPGPEYTVVLVNCDLADTLGFAILPSIPDCPSLLGVPCFFCCLVPEPHGAAAGNPGAASSGRRSAALGQAAQAHSGRSLSVG